MCNVDGTSVLASEETVKVIGGVDWKNNKNMEDVHDDIMIVGVGYAVGSNGPLTFWPNVN